MSEQFLDEKQLDEDNEVDTDLRRQVMPQNSPSRPLQPDVDAPSWDRKPQPRVEGPTLAERAEERGLVAPKRKRAPTAGSFKPGDERINKRGRPRIPNSQKELRELITRIAGEIVHDDLAEDDVDRLTKMIRGMLSSRSPVDHGIILDRLAGAVRRNTDVTSGGQRLGWGAFIALTVAPPSSLPADGDVTDGSVADDGDVIDSAQPLLDDGADAGEGGAA